MENNNLIIVARILVKENKRDFVKNELLKLVALTREEKGCNSYDLHQDIKNQNSFLIFENWENRELWKQHMNNDNLTQYAKATENCVQEFVVQEMNKLV